MNPPLRFRTVTGSAIAPLIDALAALRVQVFRDWPYLYDGDRAYEARYLADYARDGTVLVAAFDGEQIVGAATGMPLAQHDPTLSKALAAHPVDPEHSFYCAESILLPAYRGQGAGHVFFDRREAHARGLGLRHSLFCAVRRAADHPLRPADHRPLDPFWRKRGYQPLPGASITLNWRDIDERAETAKPLDFWIKTL